MMHSRLRSAVLAVLAAVAPASLAVGVPAASADDVTKNLRKSGDLITRGFSRLGYAIETEVLDHKAREDYAEPTDRQYIEALYRELIERPPSVKEMDRNLHLLARGKDRKDLRERLLDSPVRRAYLETKTKKLPGHALDEEALLRDILGPPDRVQERRLKTGTGGTHQKKIE